LLFLYKDVKFYLPTFADFRGRIYTLSNYLSIKEVYSRALLLFSDSNNQFNINNSKYISPSGYEYLKLFC